MKTKLIIVLNIFISVVSYSQSLKQKMADKYFLELAYEKCAPMYAELAKKENATTDIIRKAANSYSFLNSPKDAEKWYAILVQKSDAKPIDYYDYAQTLLSNKKYEDAKIQMNKFYSLNSNNSVGKKYSLSESNYFDSMKKDSLNVIIKNIEGLNSSESDMAPAYLSDNELVFTSSRENHQTNNIENGWDNTTFLDLYIAKIDTAKQTVEKVQRYYQNYQSLYHDGPVSFNNERNIMLLTRSNFFENKIKRSKTNIINVQLYYAIKTGTKWGDLKPFPYNNPDYCFGNAVFARDGKTIYFQSDMPGTIGNSDIWMTTFDGINFSEPKNLGREVNTEGREMFPFVDDDNLLLFASDGYLGLGGLDINIASLNSPIKYIGNIGYPINSNADDFGLIYNTKTRKGYFTSNRENGKGKDDIYSLRFEKPPVIFKNIKIRVYDDKTNIKIPYAKVYIHNQKGELIQEIQTNENGICQIRIPENTDIKTEIQKLNYKNFHSELTPYQNILDSVSYTLTKQTINISAKITDSINNTTIENAEIQIIDMITNNTIYKGFTNSKGEFNSFIEDNSLNDSVKYKVIFIKNGFEQKEYTIVNSKSDYAENEVKSLNIKLQAKENNDIININPIFFDYNKSALNDFAKSELDKLSKVLNAKKDIIIELTSSTDCKGNRKYNLDLSKRRAQSTASYLINKGVSKKQLQIKWTGEDNLTNCSCEPNNDSPCSDEEHQKNRTTKFKVSSYKINSKNLHN